MRFLIAYGPTREPLDPVRYISNYSTGSMGRYLSEVARARGHEVDCVECPQDAQTALDLLRQLKKRLPKSDVLVMAAAVCDARPASVSAHKIKKDKLSSIKLVKNPDLLAELSKTKKKGQIFIGFALESENGFKNAYKKLLNKKLELIVLQKVTYKKTPFGDKPIDAYFLDAGGCVQPLKKIHKRKLAGLVIRGAEMLGKLHKSRD